MPYLIGIHASLLARIAGSNIVNMNEIDEGIVINIYIMHLILMAHFFYTSCTPTVLIIVNRSHTATQTRIDSILDNPVIFNADSGTVRSNHNDLENFPREIVNIDNILY